MSNEDTKKYSLCHGAELEQIITAFSAECSNCVVRYNFCEEQEKFDDDKTQDILHAIEFDSVFLPDLDLVNLLRDIRAERRLAKDELEIAKIFKSWCERNRPAIEGLKNSLGDIRKVLKKQNDAAYFWKTDVVGEKGAVLESREEPTLIQLTLF